jgi:alpha-mannosidase
MILPSLLLAAAVTASADFAPVFSIGVIDGSCADLKIVPLDATIGRYNLDHPIEPAEWPAVQPGAVDAWAGSRPFTYRFVFTRPSASTPSAGTFRVRIGFLGAHPYSPPTLRVQIGDGVWTDHALKPGKQYIPRENAIQEISPSVLELDVPATALPPSGPVTVAISQVRPCSWVFYDGIEVLYSAEATPPEITDVEVKPLPLIRASDGSQVLRLRARCRGVPAPLFLRVDTPSGPIEQEVHAGGSSVLNGDVDTEVFLDPAEEPRTLEARLIPAPGAAPTRACFEQRPVRHFELYVVPQAHFDNGYTHPQHECLDRAIQNLRAALDLASRFDNFSWTSESAFIVQQWWEHAPQAERDRFLALTRSGRLGFDAAYCNILSGLCTGEELRRLFSFAGAFAAAQRIDLRTVSLTDVPSHTWSLPQVLADAGIEFLSIGGNQTRGGFWRLGEDLFWKPALWEGPDGSRVFTLIHRHYAHATIVGLTASLAQAERDIPKWLQPYDTPEYPYHAVHLHGAYWDNALADSRLPETVRAWNDKYLWPRVRLSTNADFLERLRAEASGQLPVIRGDGGAYWEDGAASSAALTTVNRDTARRLAMVENFLAALHARGVLPEYPAEQLRAAWENVLLYDEHTWGAAWSITRPDDPGTKQQFDRKARYATDAQRQVADLIALAARHEPALATPDRTPSLSGVHTEGHVITSPFYRVALDPGTGLISSIKDLAADRELVDPGDPAGTPAFGQLLYETKQRRRPPDSNDLATESARSVPELVSIEPIPGGLRSRFRHGMFPRMDMMVVLDAGAPRILLQYDLEKRPTTDCEGVYFAFPFAFEAPLIDYDNAGAVVRAGRDWLPHACLDWFTTESFVRVRDADSGYGVVWSSPDAPLFELQDVTTHRALNTLPIRNGRLFSYVMNNYWETNYKASQEGPFRFRYAITSGLNPSIEGALDFASPWSAAVTEALAAIASAEPPSVRISAFKRAEDGNGYILRLWNAGGFEGAARVRVGALKSGAVSAERVSSIETSQNGSPRGDDRGVELKEGEIRVQVRPAETITLRVRR